MVHSAVTAGTEPNTNLVGPFFVPNDHICLSCYQPLTITALLGMKDRLLTFCSGCGQRPVQCSCPPPPEHRWAKR